MASLHALFFSRIPHTLMGVLPIPVHADPQYPLYIHRYGVLGNSQFDHPVEAPGKESFKYASNLEVRSKLLSNFIIKAKKLISSTRLASGIFEIQIAENFSKVVFGETI